MRKTAELLEDDYAKVADVVKTVYMLMIYLRQKHVLKMLVNVQDIDKKNIASSQEIMTYGIVEYRDRKGFEDHRTMFLSSKCKSAA